MEKPIVIYTDHIINRTVCYNFAKGSDSLLCHVKNFNDYNKTIATYGVLRGTLDIINKVKNYYYMDHGYFNQSKRLFENNRTNVINLHGYFRIVHNNFVHNGKGNFPSDRFKKLDLKIFDQKKTGEYIIISEPSEAMKQVYNVPKWTDETIKLVKKYTDRKLVLHNKFSKEPLNHLLKKAWAFVSLQSTAGFTSMLNGVPSFFTDSSLNYIGKIQDIENPVINYNIFNNLAYGQWTLKEIETGMAWDYISKNIS
ncbi:hypothetical protein OA855_03320 [Pelagibacteraceae bacterium]|nr:hypothetical protein [Pelagibacteraceae bacterium]